MSLSINRKIFDRVKAAIAETGRINMLSWAESRESMTAESVAEIRELPLLGDCQTTACIVCFRQPGLKKAKKAHPLSPPSGAPRRIGAIVDEERPGSKFDRPC